MKSLLKNGREQKGLKTREVAQILNIDQALISKFESGLRKPTKEQVLKLSELLEIDYETLMVDWLKEKILHEIEHEEFALKALAVAEQELKYRKSVSTIKLSNSLERILKEIDLLKVKVEALPKNEFYEISKNLDLEYTYESNRMKGNTMTLRETEMVINEGLTIPGKSMREHLEAINHHEAIRFIKDLQQKSNSFNEQDLLSIHNLILRGINPEAAGSYRKTKILNNESFNIDSEPIIITKEIEEYFFWYETNKSKLHPVILAAEMHFRLLKINPFSDGNGRTSRLIMNLILLQKGYLKTNIKGDNDNKKKYSQLTENNDSEDFIFFIAQAEKESLEKYIRS
ncbi:Fic family protein [Flavobacterium hydrophilum]|uniref:DNA-binding protein n=1 Tax=Flavobacterium hydrophilum TaxID=2211445 RepID=A0A2V4CLG0_9FLAO|nr:Fic family protein [Flavobacterium hydrophilum]PXY46584.1 DNA-binding protein [Flavobacterium hydrophilum]